MNNELYFWGTHLSLSNIYISLIGIFINLIYECFFFTLIVSDSKSFLLITQNQWKYIIIFILIIIFIWVNILLMSLTENLLIDIKINDSYHAYELAIDYENNIRQRNENANNAENINTNIDEIKSKNNQDMNVNEIKSIRNLISIDRENDNIGNVKGKDVITKNKNFNIKINNNINNNYNINIEIKNENDKRNIISSVNQLLVENNNMKQDLKDNEEKKI